LIAGFPEMTVQSVSEPLAYDPAAAPVASVLSAAYQPDSQIVLTWSDLSNETGYIVEKSTDGVNFSQIAALGADVTTYTDAPVDFDSLYYYQVYAFNDLGNSPMSNVATVATPPTAPTDLMGTYRD